MGNVGLMILIPGLLVCSPVWAGTPDGATPANEGVCDVLAYHTPGLYGLCIAYCEAHDADLISPEGDLNDLNVPNRKILENYRKKMRKGDPDMPCVQTPCPCWSAEELAGLRYPSSTDTVGCTKDAEVTNNITNIDGWSIRSAGNFITSVTSVGALVVDPLCILRDTCADGNCLNVNRRFFSITQEEFEVCEPQVASSAADRGLDLTQADCGI